MTGQEIVRARLSPEGVKQLDADRELLGLRTRSEAVREGLRLLHRQARYAALGRNYDDFYGADAQNPVSDVAAVGDQIAAEAIDMEVDPH